MSLDQFRNKIKTSDLFGYFFFLHAANPHYRSNQFEDEGLILRIKKTLENKPQNIQHRLLRKFPMIESLLWK